MTRYLLDSDAIIDYLADIAPTIALLQALNRQGDVLCTCDVVIAEVFAGVVPAERSHARTFLASFEFLAATEEAARQAGEWRYAFARAGRTLQTTDCLIAATALVYGTTLVSGNLRDYPMAEIPVLPLPRPQRGGSR